MTNDEILTIKEVAPYLKLAEKTTYHYLAILDSSGDKKIARNRQNLQNNAMVESAGIEPATSCAFVEV
jgi:hypothetical protein